ncbi:hypothetical protein PYCCODRAFT_315612 [Trametes coccinea BRFM310]|uniref:Uncharacterized protein n=1 Tax=Trametes coccinea (strain BRFM310) TaxID=1353009 RepID=A0A1Y2IQG7_TRAC3|nr:hypothetical protein PYCCODRAFT_315612 [Trametes coccinea BRFM310]
MVACTLELITAHPAPARCSLPASNPRFSNSKTSGMHERTLFVSPSRLPSPPYPSLTCTPQPRAGQPAAQAEPSTEPQATIAAFPGRGFGGRRRAALDSGSNSFWAVSSFELRGLRTRRNTNLPAPRVPSALNVETIAIGARQRHKRLPAHSWASEHLVLGLQQLSWIAAWPL